MHKIQSKKISWSQEDIDLKYFNILHKYESIES